MEVEDFTWFGVLVSFENCSIEMVDFLILYRIHFDSISVGEFDEFVNLMILFHWNGWFSDFDDWRLTCIDFLNSSISVGHFVWFCKMTLTCIDFLNSAISVGHFVWFLEFSHCVGWICWISWIQPLCGLNLLDFLNSAVVWAEFVGFLEFSRCVGHFVWFWKWPQKRKFARFWKWPQSQWNSVRWRRTLRLQRSNMLDWKWPQNQGQGYSGVFLCVCVCVCVCETPGVDPRVFANFENDPRNAMWHTTCTAT
jgi:hypothetical protein